MTEITEAVDFNVAPFAADGIGTLMDKGARAYLEDYAYSPDPDGHSADHELTAFEKDMAYDFLAGLFTDERFFGPVRQALSELTRLQEEVKGPTYQARVGDWMLACFGEAITHDTTERNHRFLEESLELVQALGCTASEAHQLVDYVFGRGIGEPGQEVGGVMVTLAALCNTKGLDIDAEAERELARIWTKVESIRAKQAGKPKHSPLPGPSATLQGQRS